MNKKILIITIISAVILLAMPSFPAIEYQICLDEANSQNSNNQVYMEICIADKLKNLKDMNLIEIWRVVKNIDIDDLKENIIYDIRNSELTDREKLSVEKLFCSARFSVQDVLH